MGAERNVCRPCTTTDSWREREQSSQAPRPQDMPTGRGTMCTQQFLLLGGGRGSPSETSLHFTHGILLLHARSASYTMPSGVN